MYFFVFIFGKKTSINMETKKIFYGNTLFVLMTMERLTNLINKLEREESKASPIIIEVSGSCTQDDSDVIVCEVEEVCDAA